MTTIYAKRDTAAQGEHFTRHMSAMTGEGLHAKSAIAAELAHRDMEIERLQKLLNLQQQSYEREIALEVAAERARLRALAQAVRDANAADSAQRMLTARQEAAWVALMDGLDGPNVGGNRLAPTQEQR